MRQRQQFGAADTLTNVGADSVKVAIGLPAYVSVEVPAGFIVRFLTGMLSKRRRLTLVPQGGQIWLHSYCEGYAEVGIAIVHPSAAVCPVERIDVEGWAFNHYTLGIQPFFANVVGGKGQFVTAVKVTLQLGEAQINRIKSVMGPSLLSSDALRATGLPYPQDLEIRLHFRGRRRTNSQLHALTFPHVIVQASGRLDRVTG
jgi:hypothetical protein